jgi:putative hydrolase of the HAD superfamily
VAFKKINTGLWHLYDTGQIKQDVIRQHRFHRVFQEFGVEQYELSLQFSGDYVSLSPKKKNLLPHAKEVLDYLQPNYPMHIITNGFSEIQATKLTSSGIYHYFKSIVTSEKAGHKKPSKEIFEYAMIENNLLPHEVIMIGDNLLTDMAGARNASIDTIFFNPEKITHQELITHEIFSLHELNSLL